MGIAYERCLDFYKKFHSHDRLILVFPRPSCQMLIKTKTDKKVFKIDETSALLTPSGIEHDDKGISEIYDTLALLPDKAFIEKVAAQENHDLSKFYKMIGPSLKFKKSDWLHQQLEHYFVERVLMKKNSSANIIYLEFNIINEIFSLILYGKSQMEKSGVVMAQESITKRAIHLIEANLFSTLHTSLIIKKICTSKSTLFRVFKKDTGRTPYQYIRERRLEEAKKMLSKGIYTVSEVAILVGYENFGAFSEAFKTKFKKSPSFYKKSSAP